MTQNDAKLTPIENTRKRREAAQLVADDVLTDLEIADKLGISRATLTRWKRSQNFRSQVGRITEAYAERALKHRIARKERRLTVLADIHDKLLEVIDERSEWEEVAHVPGGKTGLITKTLKGIGKGDDFQVVEVYEVDTGTLKEIRAVQEQVAEELGQKVSRHQLTGPGGGPIEVNLNARDKLLGKLASGSVPAITAGRAPEANTRA
jgi:transcriptional regulator with XRE-family HTH domain